MLTFQMTIVNEDNRKKIVVVSGNTYLEAVGNMKSRYGRNWVVHSSKMISAY